MFLTEAVLNFVREKEKGIGAKVLLDTLLDATHARGLDKKNLFIQTRTNHLAHATWVKNAGTRPKGLQIGAELSAHLCAWRSCTAAIGCDTLPSAGPGSPEGPRSGFSNRQTKKLCTDLDSGKILEK